MALRSDADGFLIGEPLDMDDALDLWRDVRDDTRAILNLLRKRHSGAETPVAAPDTPRGRSGEREAVSPVGRGGRADPVAVETTVSVQTASAALPMTGSAPEHNRAAAVDAPQRPIGAGLASLTEKPDRLIGRLIRRVDGHERRMTKGLRSIVLAIKELAELMRQPGARGGEGGGSGGFLDTLAAMVLGWLGLKKGGSLLNSLTERLTGRSSNAGGPGPGPRPGPTPDGPDRGRGGRGGWRSAVRSARGIPGLGALLGLGFMASDVYDSETDETATREEKDVNTGRAIGAGLGAGGGALAGGMAGAAIGSVVPVIGTTIGGIVGALAGAYFGGSAGEPIGEKVGGWVSELRGSDLVATIADKWQYAVDFTASLSARAGADLSALWTQTTETVKERFVAVGSALTVGWETTRATLEASWLTVSAAWSSAAEWTQARWESVTAASEAVWSSISERFAGASEWAREQFTGIKTAFDGVAEWVTGAWGGLKDTAQGAVEQAAALAESAKVATVEAASAANAWVAEQTGVDVAAQATAAVEATAQAAESAKETVKSAWESVTGWFSEAKAEADQKQSERVEPRAPSADSVQPPAEAQGAVEQAAPALARADESLMRGIVALDEAALAADLGVGGALRHTATASTTAGAVSDVMTLGQKTEASALNYPTIAAVPTAPETIAAVPTAPESIAAVSAAPESIAAVSAAPESVAAVSAAPESVAAVSAAPESVAAVSAAPESIAVDTTPIVSTSESALGAVERAGKAALSAWEALKRRIDAWTPGGVEQGDSSKTGAISAATGSNGPDAVGGYRASAMTGGHGADGSGAGAAPVATSAGANVGHSGGGSVPGTGMVATASVGQGDKALLERIAHGEGTSDVKARAQGFESGYDVSYGFGKYSPKGGKKLSEMTLGEVKQYQEQMLANQRGNKLQSTAVGKYQFIRKTLNATQKKLGLSDDTIFSPEVQDQMGMELLKTRGYDQWKAGKKSDQAFQKSLSQEWASIANPDTGRSYYGQHVGTTDAEIKQAMAAAKSGAIAPASTAAVAATSTDPVINDEALKADLSAGGLLRQTASASTTAGARSDVPTLSQATEASALALQQAPGAPLPGQATQSVVRAINQGATRNKAITPELEARVHEAVRAVYGEGARADLYSGGQDKKGQGTRRTGSTRHDEGKAGDFRFYDAEGKQITGDALGKIGQYWTAKGYGGVGMEMRGGGVHLDEHTDRAKSWGYEKDGGRYTKAQREAIKRGLAGELPELKMDPAVAALPGKATTATTTAGVQARASDPAGAVTAQAPAAQATASPTTASAVGAPSAAQAWPASAAGTAWTAGAAGTAPTSKPLDPLTRSFASMMSLIPGTSESWRTAAADGAAGGRPASGMMAELLSVGGNAIQTTLGALAQGPHGLPRRSPPNPRDALKGMARAAVPNLAGMAGGRLHQATAGGLGALAAIPQQAMGTLAGLPQQAVGALSGAVAPMMSALSVAPPMPSLPASMPISIPGAAPSIQEPATSPRGLGGAGERKDNNQPMRHVGQDVRDRRIAHIVTGGIGAAL